MSVAAWAALASVGLHATIAVWFCLLPDPRHRKRPPRTVPITISATPRTPPPPPPPVRVPPVLRPRPVRPATPMVRKRIEMPPPTIAPAPPLRAETSPPIFGVSMESVTEGASSVAADVGNTLAADPSTARRSPGPPPPPVFSPTAPDVVPPKVLRPVQAPYPRAASEAGVSGKVLLLLTIDEQGRVTKARILRRLGFGLDEAAVEAVKQFTFSPGTVDGREGPMEIRYTYTFVLDD